MKKNFFSDLNNRLSPIALKRIDFWVGLLSFCVSVIFIGAAAIEYGFDIDAHEMLYINKIFNFTWGFYFVIFSLRFIFNIQHKKRQRIVITIIFAVLLYASALPKFFSLSSESAEWMTATWRFLSNKYYLFGLLSIFALIEISRGIVSFINKNTNPALLMAASFAVIIFFGTLFLLMPRSTLENIRLTIVDALFIATSATCVTGLTPLDISSTFSIEGQIIIVLLIQIGGIGVMTITSFFALFFMGGGNLYSQFALRDMLGSDRFGSLSSTLLHILGFTFTIELCGALLIWIEIHSTMGMVLKDEIFFSVFHAISAFCNAGFSTLPGNLGNSLVISGHNWLYIIISILVFLGGIGFPILVNISNIFSYRFHNIIKRIFQHKRNHSVYTHLININTKIVLITSLLLIIIGTTAIAIIEWDGAFSGMPVADKIVHSLFNSIVPRTAGFNSIDLTGFSLLTILVYIFLMWIGGASQSTAGGIKVNTFAVAFSNFKSVVRGRDSVIVLNREISSNSVKRASATIFGSIITITLFFMALVIMDPGIPSLGLLFETVSAIGTVGSSLNITPLLGENSKVLISVLMFIGRVGIITIIMGFIRQHGAAKYRLPKDDIIIN